MAAEQASDALFAREKQKTRLAEISSSLLRFAVRKPLGAIGAIIILVMILLAVFPQYIAPYEPNLFTGERYAFPGTVTNEGRVLLGTDELQRDILSRAIWGARISVRIGIISVFLGVTVGLVIGAVAGYILSLIHI